MSPAPEPEVDAAPVRLLFRGGKVRAKDAKVDKRPSARGNEGLLLRAMATRDSVDWAQGFLLFPSWCECEQTTNTYAEQFRSYAHKAAGLLRACLGPQFPGVEDVCVKSISLHSAWQLITPFELTSNAHDSDETLEAAKTAFAEHGDEVTAWDDITKAFTDVSNDSELVDSAKLLDALQFAEPQFASRNVDRDLRDRIENTISSYNTQLVLAITKVVCLAHEELLGITPQIAQDHVPAWMEQVGQARECLALLQAARAPLPSLAGAEVDSFVDAANDCRKLLGEWRNTPSGAADHGLAEQDLNKGFARLLTTNLSAIIERETRADFSAQRRQGVTDQDINTFFGPAMRSYVAQYPCHFWPNRGLRAQLCSFVRRYIWRECHGVGELLCLYAEPGIDKEFAAHIRSMLDRVKKSGEAMKATKDILRSFRKSRPGVSSAGALKQLQAHLRRRACMEDAQAGQYTDGLYVPLKLVREPASGMIEPRTGLEANGRTECGTLRMTRTPFDPHELVSPKHHYVLIGPSGAGKTTLLRHLWPEILAQQEQIGVYAEAVDLARLLGDSPNALFACLGKLLCNGVASHVVRKACKRAAEDHKLILLIDQPERVEQLGITVTDFLGRLVPLLENARVVIAAREPEAQGASGHSGFRRLWLAPFDLEGQKAIFGDCYKRALRLTGSHNTLLSHPMHAALLRSLLSTPQAETVRNRWQLYSCIIHQQLFEHAPSKRAADPQTSPTLPLEAIERVAYAAIDREGPLVGRVPYDCWRRVANPAEIKQLSRVGLISLILPRSNVLGPDVAFPHASFQEYFAASWLRAHPADLDHVLEEYWRPKWREVLIMLAGAPETEFFSALYSGPDCDNEIHARLYLAARCVAQRASHPLARDIVRDLTRIVEDEVMTHEALDSLLEIDTRAARDVVWQFISGRRRSMGSISASALEHLDRLYHPARLRWALDQSCVRDRPQPAERPRPLAESRARASHRHGLSPVAAEAADLLSAKPNLEFNAIALLEAWAARLSRGAVCTVLARLYQTPFESASLYVSILTGAAGQLVVQDLAPLIQQAAHDPKAQEALSNLQRWLPARLFPGVARAVDSTPPEWTDAHEELAMFLSSQSLDIPSCRAAVREELQHALMRHCESTDEWGLQRPGKFVIPAIRIPRARVIPIHRDALAQVGARLELPHLRAVLKAGTDVALRPTVIAIAAGALERLRPREIQQWSHYLQSEDATSRVLLADRVFPRTGRRTPFSAIRSVLQCLDDEALAPCAIEACSWVAAQLSHRHQWRILEVAFAGGAADCSLPHFGAYAPWLDQPQTDYAMRQFSWRSPMQVRAALQLLSPTRFTDQHFRILARMFHTPQPSWVSEAAYKKLCAIHEATGQVPRLVIRLVQCTIPAKRRRHK